MSTIMSFKPIADKTAHILILGSIPGVASLNCNQYYAHPRNAFWRIMGDIFNFDFNLPYQARATALKTYGVALWDVLHLCIRPGSLDSSIETGSRIPNDFQTFFREHPNIRIVGFNGAEAQNSFNRYVLPYINSKGICFVRLPSTSPAHAVSFDKKIERWREALSLKIED